MDFSRLWSRRLEGMTSIMTSQNNGDQVCRDLFQVWSRYPVDLARLPFGICRSLEIDRHVAQMGSIEGRHHGVSPLLMIQLNLALGT